MCVPCEMADLGCFWVLVLFWLGDVLFCFVFGGGVVLCFGVFCYCFLFFLAWDFGGGDNVIGKIPTIKILTLLLGNKTSIWREKNAD